jgi:hypothetical protein
VVDHIQPRTSIVRAGALIAGVARFISMSRAIYLILNDEDPDHAGHTLSWQLYIIMHHIRS